MKRLFLLRHAKSSWKDEHVSDFDRPLNGRGKRVAPYMGKFVASQGYVIDRILSSSAKRAKETANLFREGGEFAAEIQLEHRVYEATATTLLYLVRQTDAEADSLLLVGHNPGMESTVRVLTGHAEDMPTAAFAVIDLEIDAWRDIKAGVGTLKALFRPRDLMDES